MPRLKKCAMCHGEFKNNDIPTDLSIRMPYIKGEARIEFGLEFSAKINVCDKCMEPIMETGLLHLRNKVCPHIVDIALHASMLKILWPKANELKKKGKPCSSSKKKTGRT